MSDTTTEETFFGGIADEFLQHYRTGPRFIAVTGMAGSDPARAADELAARLRDRGQDAQRATRGDETGADEFRSGTVVPFRAGDGVLVVDGPGLLEPDFSGFWNFSVWIEHDADRDADWSYVSRGQRDAVGAAREVASVLMDDAFADGPRRLFADSC